MKPNRLWQLIKGELVRLNKYNVFSISVLIALIWGLLLFFLDVNAFIVMLPLLLMIDASMMSVLFIGSVMFFEKNESTISSMLVTPATNSELVSSKVLANTIHNLFSSLLLVIVFAIIKDIEMNIPLLILGIILATAFHTIAGYFMAYYQKTFQDMMVNLMILVFVLMVPTVLYELNVIKGDWIGYVLLINPIQAAAELIGAGFKNYVFDWHYYYSLAYMVIGAILVYRFLVLPRFQDYAIRQSGV